MHFIAHGKRIHLVDKPGGAGLHNGILILVVTDIRRETLGKVSGPRVTVAVFTPRFCV
ncbi:hypothetical protein MUTS16_29190 [Escherichia coli]|nr:hypothetical protein MUTS16_29190 [Escherichia coli]